MKMIPRSRWLEPAPQIFSIRIPVLPECLKSNAPDGIFLHHLVSHIPKRCSVRQAGAFSSELQGSLKQFVAENNKEAAQYRSQYGAGAQNDDPRTRREMAQIECQKRTSQCSRDRHSSAHGQRSHDKEGPAEHADKR